MKILLILILALISYDLQGQSTNASPANWLYPDGNLGATKRVARRSLVQSFDSMGIKWSNTAISGDVKPLIGNIIRNEKLFSNFNFAPNEIVAVVGDKLVVLDAKNLSYELAQLPDFVNSVSVLFDTLLTDYSTSIQSNVIMGLETIETSRANLEDLPDTLALSYLAGFNTITNRPSILKRMAIDMRGVAPNFSASIKPFFGYQKNGNITVYAQVNTANPTIPNNYDPSEPPPFYRGVFQFDGSIELSNYPLTDIGYESTNILTMAPEVNFAQPSLSNFNSFINVLLPNFPEKDFDIDMNSIAPSFETNSKTPYLYGIDISGPEIFTNGLGFSLEQDVKGVRPKIRNHYVELWDPDNNVFDTFILISEQYNGVETSEGQASLHLFEKSGDPILNSTNDIIPSYKGGQNHYWSVATGNLDGVSANNKLPYYPNNPGNEIIVTQSTKDFAFSNSRISVLKYIGNQVVPKASPPNRFLSPFDTVCTQRVNGWIAAINDLDGASNQKDEILLVNNSTIMVLQLRDYDTQEFQLGNRFDTLFVQDFNGEIISFATIADIEGDGKNDIIVTTFNRTYVIGSPLDNVLEIIEPQTLAGELCIGDSLDLVWRNLIIDKSEVEIYFKDISDTTNNVQNMTLIADNYPNEKDSITYSFQIDSVLTGRTGVFYVRSKLNPSISDFSGTVTISSNILYIDPITIAPEYTVGDIIDFEGVTYCYDSLEVQYKTVDSEWISLLINSTQSSPTFNLSVEIPCVSIFSCDSEDLDSMATFRVVSHKYNAVVYSQTYSALIRPYKFTFNVDTAETADPSKFLSWTTMPINNYMCDSVSIYFSINRGQSFNLIDVVSYYTGRYTWTLPLELPDSVMIRMCCNNSCVRTDTLIGGNKINNIQIVAPNPVRPPLEELEIVYSVPEDGNVTISIVDNTNRVLARPVRNAPRKYGYAYTDKWNGRLSDGSLAANGMYYIKLETDAGYVELYPVFVRK